jgi:hypothetical protein
MFKKTNKSILFLILIILSILTFVTCLQSVAEGAETGFTVKGYIKPDFAYSGSSASDMLSGFKVTIDGLQVSSLTDSKGYFELKNVQSSISAYTFKVSKAGYLSRSISNVAVTNNIFLSAANSPIYIWTGDFNGDLAINMSDVMELTGAFNTVPSNSAYDMVLDINKDNSINMSDIMLIVEHFNKSVSDYPFDVKPTIDTTVTSTPVPTKVPTATKIPPSPTGVMTGRVTYTLVKASSPTADQQAAYDAITKAMDEAVRYYNQYTSIVKTLIVRYEPSVSTADGNINGSIRFGKKEYMNHITAMHEIAHTVGIGTSSQYRALIQNGVFTGTNATNALRAITGNPQDVLKGDSQHFWPYGLNYTSEVKSTADLINHCKIVNAIKKDLGI